MSEQEQSHRHNSEKRGQWMGWFLATACVGDAIYLGINGYSWTACFMVAVGVTSLTGRISSPSSHIVGGNQKIRRNSPFNLELYSFSVQTYVG